MNQVHYLLKNNIEQLFIVSGFHSKLMELIAQAHLCHKQPRGLAVELFSWKTTFNKDHSEVCLPREVLFEYH